ncbi:uncharacterized protein HMPREF1541_04817 [Cyphellophora europaea CBS 101466]|uniref:Ketoreductase domain-containing protein n=1 Tax=Cyphellophora europaea (strain CBS 101466) TaxID=1220924 RepID=W2RW42_CYPE1|nr:uncharacterized protein HMPREF1541_04817 [Cyphellophora europaea CBS 101466]ETN40540.1 hypothetical protein HMPREF1541_04817 [Cyphellophora europaea CBS 101466]
MADLPPQTLTGKVAIVTGSARGLGASMALDLASRGASVVITYTSASSDSIASDLASRISSLANSSSAIAVRANMSDPSAPDTIVKATVEAFGHIDILVNNAAIQVTRSLKDISTADYESVYAANIRGVIFLTQVVLRHFRAPGRIVNISSVGARLGFAELSLYCSSKAGLEGLTRSWAGELGEDGTTVNAVAPGPVQSEMLESIPKELVARQKEDTPVEKRLGTPEEVSRVVCWLASEDASWVTGQTINCSGGFSMI